MTIEQTLECGIVWLKVAIHNKNLELVKMLIEFEEEPETSAKKMWNRRNKIKVEKFLVDVAIECAARDIVKYLGRTWTIETYGVDVLTTGGQRVYCYGL